MNKITRYYVITNGDEVMRAELRTVEQWRIAGDFFATYASALQPRQIEKAGSIVSLSSIPARYAYAALIVALVVLTLLAAALG